MHDLYKQGNLPYLTVKLCPNCNELIPIDKDICPKCSYDFVTKKLTKEEKKEEKVTEKEDNNINYEEDPHYFVNTSNNNKIIYCDKCGAKIIGEQKYCGGCGALVSKRICPGCNNIVDSHLMYCTYCGYQLKEKGNVEESKEEVNLQVIKADVSNNEVIKQEIKEEKVEEHVENDPKQDEIKDEKPFSINVGRKRFFLFLQFILTLFLLVVMFLLPLFSKNSFVDEIKDIFNNDATISFINGKGFYGFIIDCLKNQTFDLSLIKSSLCNEEAILINSTLPLIKTLSSEIKLTISFVLVSIIYLSITISSLISLILSFVGMFNKKPLKGKMATSLTIIYAISTLLIYGNSFTSAFKGYDTWLLYGFIINFVLFFIIKIVFGKECRLYKKNKLEDKK